MYFISQHGGISLTRLSAGKKKKKEWKYWALKTVCEVCNESDLLSQ